MTFASSRGGVSRFNWSNCQTSAVSPAEPESFPVWLATKTAENTLRFLIAESWPITNEMTGNVHFDRWMGPIDYDGVIEQRDQMLEFQKQRADKGAIALER